LKPFLCTACQFLPDASEVMQLLLKTQTEMEELEADDPQVCYFYHYWLPCKEKREKVFKITLAFIYT